MILDLCLISEHIVNPYPTTYEDDDPFNYAPSRPNMSLFLVNKMISAEAVEIFYGKNMFEFNWSHGDPLSLQGLLDKHASTLWGIHGQYIRDVSTSFDVQDFDWLLAHSIDWHAGQNSTTPISVLHDTRLDRLVETCCMKLRFISTLRCDGVVMAVENLFCPHGCCRLEALRKAFDESLKEIRGRKSMSEGSKTSLSINGLKTQAEKDLVCQALSRPMGDFNEQPGDGMHIWI